MEDTPAPARILSCGTKDPDGKDWYYNNETHTVTWRDGRANIKGYTNLGYSYSNQSYGVNKNDHLIMDGNTRTISVNGTTIADFNKTGTITTDGVRVWGPKGGGGDPIAGGGIVQGHDRGSGSIDADGKGGGKFGDYFNLGEAIGMAFIPYIDSFAKAYDALFGKDKSASTSTEKATNVTANISKTVNVTVEKYSTTGTLRGNPSQVHKTEKDSTVDNQADAKKVFNRNNQRRIQAEQKAKRENEITN